MRLGTFSTTTGGVAWSRGRGAARVSLIIDFGAIKRWARKTAQDEKALWKSAYAAACSGLKKKFYSVVRNAGGVEGVPKFRDFEEFTNELRSIRGRTSPMGGILADKSSIGAWTRNGWQYIGWKDYLKEVAVRFQDGGSAADDKWFSDPGYRRSWHMQGIRDVPRSYAHNPRRVLPQPFGDYVERYLHEWASGAYYKKLARLMAKNGAVSL